MYITYIYVDVYAYVQLHIYVHILVNVSTSYIEYCYKISYGFKRKIFCKICKLQSRLN